MQAERVIHQGLRCRALSQRSRMHFPQAPGPGPLGDRADPAGMPSGLQLLLHGHRGGPGDDGCGLPGRSSASCAAWRIRASAVSTSSITPSTSRSPGPKSSAGRSSLRFSDHLAVHPLSPLYRRRVRPPPCPGDPSRQSRLRERLPRNPQRHEQALHPEEVRRASRMLADAGIKQMGFLLLGGPGETRETVEESIAFAESLPVDTVKATVRHPDLSGNAPRPDCRGGGRRRPGRRSAPSAVSTWRRVSGNGSGSGSGGGRRRGRNSSSDLPAGHGHQKRVVIGKEKAGRG